MTEEDDLDLLADNRRSGPWARLLWTTTSRRHPHSRQFRVTAAVASAGVLAAVVVSVLPGHLPTSALATIRGISITPSRSGTAALIATFSVVPLVPHTQVVITGVVGPGIRSAERASPGSPGTPAEQAIEVVPDCADLQALDAPAYDERYHLLLARQEGSQLSAARAGVMPSNAADLRRALRASCWHALAQRSLQVEDVAAEPASGQSRVVLHVRLRNESQTAAGVDVLDIANVSTVAASDSAVVPADAERSFDVRVPVDVCPAGPPARPSGTSDLSWAVGPPDGDPATILHTSLTEPQREVVRRAVDHLCGPAPPVSVHVTGVEMVRPIPEVVVDGGGVALRIRLVVGSPGDRIVLGEADPALTSDARVAITSTSGKLRDGRADLVVVWSARCSGGRLYAPPLLPVSVMARGRTYAWVAPLSAGVLARAYRDACSATTSALVAAGWPPNAP